MRPRYLVAVVALLLVAVGAGAWLFLDLRKPPARASAQEFAAESAQRLSAGKVPSVLADTGAEGAQKALTAAVKGMGSLPHQVAVQSVVLAPDERTGTVTFSHVWTVHADKEPWAYTTTMPITRTGDTWAASWSPTVLAPDLKKGEALSAVRLPATRGDITGDDGMPLVTARPVQRIGIDRSAVRSTDEARTSAKKVAALVDIDAEAYARSVTGAGPQAFVEAITYRDPSADLARVESKLAAIPGALTVADERPLGPTSTFAMPLLGRVGEATAEILEKSAGKVRAGDVVGLGGVQATHNDKLAGNPGYAIHVTAPGGAPRSIHQVAAQDGQQVQTTLDLRLQMIAEKSLATVKPASAIVVVRPSNGHVVVAASGPGSNGYSTATLGQYAPGSTFKAVTALSLLRGGLTPRDPLDCTATITVDGRSFKNYDDFPTSNLGRIPLSRAFAHSCNTALIGARGRLQPSSLSEAAAALGLGGDPALGVPAALGTVPTTDGDTDLAASTIGQGRILATPLGMATVAASIGAGHPVRPVFLLDPTNPQTTTTGQGVTAAEAEQLRTLMRAVVTDGSATFLSDIGGEPVMAKTGTAEYGSDTPPRTHAWMIAIQRDLAVAVFVEDGHGGARTAGPILEGFLKEVGGE